MPERASVPWTERPEGLARGVTVPVLGDEGAQRSLLGGGRPHLDAYDRDDGGAPEAEEQDALTRAVAKLQRGKVIIPMPITTDTTAWACSA
jgi:hypothetical protein